MYEDESGKLHIKPGTVLLQSKDVCAHVTPRARRSHPARVCTDLLKCELISRNLRSAPPRCPGAHSSPHTSSSSYSSLQVNKLYGGVVRKFDDMNPAILEEPAFRSIWDTFVEATGAFSIRLSIQWCCCDAHTRGRAVLSLAVISH